MEMDIDLYKRCRACLIESEELGDINCIIFKDVQLSSIFIQLFGSESFLDTYPKLLCKQCIRNTKFIYLFKLKCELSMKTIRQYLENKTLNPPHREVTTNLELDEIHIKTELPDVDIEETIPESFHNETIHINAAIKDENKSLTDCNPITQSNDPFIENKSLQVPQYISVVPLNNLCNEKKIQNDHQYSIIPQDNGSCIDIKTQNNPQYITISQLRHPRTFQRYTFECIQCKKILASKEALLQHGRWHKLLNSVNNNSLNKNFFLPKTNGDLKHLKDVTGDLKDIKDVSLIKRKKHNKTTLSCKYCGKKYMNLSSLKFHEVKQHTGHRFYSCVKCLQRFAEKHELAEHKEKFHETTECDMCGMECDSSRALRRHMFEHRKDRVPSKPRNKPMPLDKSPVVYSCFKCETVCGPIEELRRHMAEQHKLHPKNKLRLGLKCEHCNKRYTRDKDMFHHRRKCREEQEAKAASEDKPN